MLAMPSGRVQMRRVAWVVGMALVSSCAQAESGRVIVRDSAGVTIVDNRAPLDGDAQRIIVDSVPIVDIRGDGRDDFGGHIVATRFPGGPIAVADGNRILWFNRSGEFVRSTGRSGKGPGEFSQIDLLQTFGDSLLIYDLGSRRVTVFDSAGRLGRVTTVLSADSAAASFPLGVFADGQLLLGSYPRPAPGIGIRRDSVTLRVGSATGEFTALIGRFPWVDQLVQAVPGGISMRRVVHARIAFWRTFEAQVLVATNERFSYDWYDRKGRLLRSIRRQWTPSPVTDDDVRAQVEEWLSSFPPGMEERKAQARAEFSAAPRPAEKPPHGAVLVTETGDVWVQEYNEPGQRSRASVYSVFDRDGRWLTQATVPAGVTPVVIGTVELLATWRDPDDVIHVRAYRFQHEK